MTTNILQEIVGRQGEFDSIFSSTYREEPIKFDVNPLVLSVCLKRIKEGDALQWYRLEDPHVKSQLESEDFNQAEAIKEYYSKKLMWSSLKDTRISDYRSHLVNFLQHPKTTLTKKEVGMVVTLPYFYAEDQVLDSIIKNYRVTDCPRVTPNMSSVTRELVYIHHTSRWINKKKFIFYWFADDNRYVYNIQIEEGNLLRKFFEHTVLTKGTSVFETYISKVDYPFDYYKMFDFKVIK